MRFVRLSCNADGRTDGRTDASTDASEVFDQITTTFQKVHERINKRGEKCLLHHPSVVVVTVKCPYKTEGSLGRVLQGVRDQLPDAVRCILNCVGGGGTGTDVMAQYAMVHLMANSDSERTVVILFQKKACGIGADDLYLS